MEAGPAKLEIATGDRARELIGREGAELVFGSTGIGDRVPVPGRFVSRLHARIVCDDQYFVLIDDSTNGTYVQTEDGKTTFIRRSEIRLWGQGFFSLGEPPTRDNAIRFQHVD